MRKKRGGALVVLLACVLAVPTVACLMGELSWDAKLEVLRPYLAVGTLLGLAHILLRPLLRLITLPLGCITFGLSGTVIDVLLIYFCAGFVRGFELPGLLYALLTALLINGVCAVTGR